MEGGKSDSNPTYPISKWAGMGIHVGFGLNVGIHN
jgi:hypothetical protein